MTMDKVKNAFQNLISHKTRDEEREANAGDPSSASPKRYRTIAVIAAAATLSAFISYSVTKNESVYDQNRDLPEVMLTGEELLEKISEPIPNQFIVTFQDGVNPAEQAKVLTEEGDAPKGEILFVYPSLNGAAVELPPERHDLLASSASVKNFTADTPVVPAGAGTQSPAGHWGLDRLDSTSTTLDQSYTYPADGRGVRVYIFDSGIRSDHVEYAGRLAEGVTFYGTNTEDCDGHGTQVAGIVGGLTYGVAKNATLVPVKFWCSSGTASYGVAALEWIIANHPSGTPGVINVSYSGVYFPPELIELASSRNLLIVASAGNTDGGACSTPASLDGVMSVGAISSGGSRVSRSAIGSCVDLFAPTSVITTSSGGSTATKGTSNGTSWSAPHVAGVAAVIFSMHPGISAEEVRDIIINRAITDTIPDPGAGSPNRVVHLPLDAVRVGDAGLMSPDGSHVYVTSEGEPAVISKVATATDTVVGSVTLNAGESRPNTAIISSDGTKGFFATSDIPAKIVEVNLSDMTRTRALTLNSGENTPFTSVISADGTKGFFATSGRPGKIVEVNLADLTRTQALSLSAGENTPRSVVLSADGTKAFFGTDTAPGRIVEVNLTNLTRTGAITLLTGEDYLTSAASVDSASEAFFGTNTAPGRVVKVTLSPLSRVIGKQFESGDNYLLSAVPDSGGSAVWFATATTPTKYVKVE